MREIVDTETLRAATAFCQEKLNPFPKTAIVLGSGLGDFADALETTRALATRDIPGYHPSTVEGHRGRWVIGKHDGREILAVQGRIHGYEGHSHAAVAFPVHLMSELGIHNLIVTNAAGGINRFYAPGHFMVIVDHINLTFDNPLFGRNDHRLGPRFPDMVAPYDPEFIAAAMDAGVALGIPVHRGVYLGVRGPSYETAAEIRMAERLGADGVGMSTVPEVIVAVYRGLRILGISCITNMATGITTEKLRHSEVTEVASRVKRDFIRLIGKVLETIEDGK